MIAIRAALVDAARRLSDAGVDDARTEAELLLARVLGCDRAGLVARRDDDLSDDDRVRFLAWVERRERREPFQHLTRTQEFRGLPFQVGPDVLIPRPETEGLVEAMLDLDLPDDATVADLGCGSGCIAIALAVERPRWRFAALDVSAPALALARKNADCLGVASRIDFVLGSMSALPSSWGGRFEAVVSNPPYVALDAWRGLEPEVRDHEPRIALTPGATGLEMYRAMAPEGFRVLTPGGALVVELGHDSEAGARAAFVGAGFEVEGVRPDFQGIPRVLVARRPRAALVP